MFNLSLILILILKIFVNIGSEVYSICNVYSCLQCRAAPYNAIDVIQILKTTMVICAAVVCVWLELVTCTLKSCSGMKRKYFMFRMFSLSEKSFHLDRLHKLCFRRLDTDSEHLFTFHLQYSHWRNVS